MKNLILFCIALLSSALFAQESLNIDFTRLMISSDANYYQIVETAEDYFIQNPDETEGGAYANLRRWEWFWENRVYQYEGNPGSFIPANNALIALSADPICVDNNNPNSNWNLIGPIENLPIGVNQNYSPDIGRIMTLAVDPNNYNTIYVASNTSGLWKTNNAFDPEPIWTSLMDDLKLPGIGINHVLIDPTNSNIIYAATGFSNYGGYGIGILKSINGGNSWEQINPIEPSPTNFTIKMAINYSNTNILYALVRDKVYKTLDGGNNWSQIFELPYSIGDIPFNQNSEARFMIDIEIHPTNPDIVYIASDDHTGAIACGWVDDICIDDGSTVFCDDFESGGFIYGGWNTDGNTIISTNDPNQGGYCFRGTGVYNIEKEIINLNDNITVEFSCKASQLVKRDIVQFKLIDNEGDIGPFVLLSSMDGGKIAAYNGNTLESLQPLINDNWYDIKLEIDNSAKSYDVYINNQLIVANYDYFSTDFNIPKKFIWDCEQKCNDGALAYKTIDGGQNWDLVEIQSGGSLTDRISIAVTPVEPNSLFACYLPLNSSYAQVKKSTDQGNTWTTVSNPSLSISGFGRWRNGISVSPTDPQVIYIEGYWANKSTNGGYSFTQQVSNQHIDCRIIEIIEGSAIGTGGADDFLAQGHDGGVALTTTGGNPWYDINGTGLAITQYYALGGSENEYIVAGGTLDNDVSFYSGDEWQLPMLSQDGGEVVIDKNDPDVAYVQKWCCSPTNQRIKKYIYNGDYWISNGDFTPDGGYGAKIRPMLMHNNGQLFVGYRNLFKSSTPDLSWNKISDFSQNFNPNSEHISSIGVSPSNPNIIFVSYASNPCWGCPNPEGFFYKTTTGGGLNQNDWVDFTQNLPIQIPQWFNITDIEFDPKNENRIWISIGRYASDDGISGIYNGKWRVFKSEDGGASWTDYSLGLTQFPVNNIIYQKGTNDGLYAATDVGVFYRNAIMGQWECFNNGLPVSIVTDLDINYCEGKLLCSTFGRGMWESDLAENPSISYSICDGVPSVWDTDKYTINELKVCSGNSLTITSKIEFTEDAKIIVERGGKLTIDGGTLTSACGELWQGIEVWGNKNLGQTYSDQGVVEVLNGGTIENAICGINTIKIIDNTVPPPEDGIPNYNYSGGMVLCDDAIFKNNRIAVKFWPYNYTTSQSLFRHCEFISNDDMIAGTDPETFIEISDISGIVVGGSSFTDSREGLDFDDLTTGIDAYDSQFKVWAIGVPSVFTGLHYGVKTHALNPTETVEITNSDFIDSYKGVYISGITNAKVTGNDFSINSPFSIINGGYGLYLDNSTAYTVEENNFYHEHGEPDGVGLIVHNSGGDANEIYLNTFTNLKQGISCQQQNRSTNDPAPGLQILCNDFDECMADVLVPLPWISGYGIAPKQGIDGNAVTDMAGNLFFYNTVDGDYDDLNNEGSFFEYFYPENPDPIFERTKPDDYTKKTVKIHANEIYPLAWTFEDGCPPNESGGGGGGTGRDEMRTAMASAEQEITATEATLDLLVDGGDTEALNNEVETSVPPETVEVYNELMNGSPYLSETVVETSIEKEEVLPNAMIRDVMVANPHTSKSDVLLEKLDERFDPLPDYMKAQILEGRELSSIKEELESQLAGYQLKKARAFNRLARSFINESETWQEATDSLLLLFQQDGDLQSKYRLAFLHLERGEYQLGETALENIPTQYGLEADDLAKHQNIDSYYSLVREMREAGKSLLEADESQVQEFQTIEASGTGVASAWARDVLVALDETSYEEPIQMPDLLKSAAAIEAYEELLNTEPPQMLEVYPNPSTGYVILEYKLEMEAKGNIEIQDVTGKTIKAIQTNSIQDQITVVTQDWKPGVYIATLKMDGKTIESVKFTLVN